MRTALGRGAVIASALLIGTSTVGAGAPAEAAPSVGRVATLTDSAARDGFGAEVLRLTNEARSKPRTCGGKRMKAVRPLRWSASLATIATRHSTDMADHDYVSHSSPSGSSPFDRLRAAGYDYSAAGENLAAGRALADPAAVVRAWLNSPTHCKVIMNGRYRELGVGRVEGSGRYSIYWTQEFGSRK